MKNKNLLILCPSFPDENNIFYGGIFVKEYVNSISKYFNKVFIISPVPFWFNFTKKEKLCKDYSYSNVEVFYPRYFHIPIIYFRNRIWDNQYNVVRRLLENKKIKFDIIHSHFIFPSWYIWLKLKEKYGKKLVVTWHWSDVRIPLNSGNEFLKRKVDIIMDWADIVHTNHEELYDLLASNYETYIKKIEFTYKWIDIDKFNSNNKELIKNSSILKKDLGLEWKFIVLFLWNLVDFKDPITFVKVAKLIGNNKNIFFLMVWEWGLSKEINKYINDNKLNNIKILWARKDINVLYFTSDVFCALSPYENIWSTTIQEAFCMWVPSIITLSWYTNRILKDREDSLLIPSKNPKELKKAILELYSNKKLWNKISTNLLSKWRKKFNNKMLANENWDKLYRNKI